MVPCKGAKRRKLACGKRYRGRMKKRHTTSNNNGEDVHPIESPKGEVTLGKDLAWIASGFKKPSRVESSREKNLNQLHGQLGLVSALRNRYHSGCGVLLPGEGEKEWGRNAVGTLCSETRAHLGSPACTSSVLRRPKRRRSYIISRRRLGGASEDKAARDRKDLHDIGGARPGKGIESRELKNSVKCTRIGVGEHTG